MTVSSLLSLRSGSSQSVLRFKRSGSETLQTKSDSKRNLELVEKDIPDLPPFQGNLLSSGRRTNSDTNSNGSLHEDEGKSNTVKQAV